ncbi:MAG: hypothetical protein ACE5JU_17585 [Candidatus Binatia bacterium]
MIEYIGKRGPRFWGFCLGSSWVIVMTAVFGFMVSGYLEMFGIMGALFAVSLVPLSAPAYPFVSWYFLGSFPWLWVLGFVAVFLMGRVILAD